MRSFGARIADTVLQSDPYAADSRIEMIEKVCDDEFSDSGK